VKETKHFRPKPLEPPKVGVSREQYNDYVSSYRVYVSTLELLKQEFWAQHSKPEKAEKKKAVKPPKPERKQAKIKRRAERKRQLALQKEVKALRLKTSLVEAKKQYAEVLQKPAPKKSKPSGAAKPTKKALKKAGKGKGKVKDSESRRDPPADDAPSGSASTKGGEATKTKPPNRKARRQAIYGLPAGSKPQEEVKPVEPKPEKAGSEYDATSDAEAMFAPRPVASDSEQEWEDRIPPAPVARYPGHPYLTPAQRKKQAVLAEENKWPDSTVRVHGAFARAATPEPKDFSAMIPVKYPAGSWGAAIEGPPPAK